MNELLGECGHPRRALSGRDSGAIGRRRRPQAVAGLERPRRTAPGRPERSRRRASRCSTRSARPPRWACAGPRFFGFVIGGSLPGRAGRQLAGGGLGSERGVRLRHARGLAARGGRAGVDARAPRRCPRAARAPSSPAPPWPTSARSRPPGTRCSRGAGWDVEADGLFGAPPITVVIGEEAHPTLIKALGLVGFGRNRARARARRRSGPHARRSRCRRSRPATIVCAQAGNVNTGAFDPLAAIAERTREAGRLGARRRRVRPVGRRGARPRAPRWPARSWPTPGRPTRTSGSTSRTTAAWRSCATPRRCARRWP